MKEVGFKIGMGVRDSIKGMEALESKIKAASNSTKIYEKGVHSINRRMTAGNLTNKEAAAQLNLLDRRVIESNRSMTKMGRTVAKVDTAFKGGISRIKAATKSIFSLKGAVIAASLAYGATSFVAFGAGVESSRDKMEALAQSSLRSSKDLSVLVDSVQSTASNTHLLQTEAYQGASALLSMGSSARETSALLLPLTELSKGVGADFNYLAEKVKATANAYDLNLSKTEELGRITQQYTGAYLTTAANAERLSEALKNVGGTAHTAKISLEETVAASALLIDRGGEASSVGTALNTILLRLADTSNVRVKKGLAALNLGFDDLRKDGKLKSLSESFETLQEKLRDLSSADRIAALSRIFGREHASKAAALAEAVDRVGGSISDYEKKIASATGTHELYLQMTDNVEGSLDKLQSTIQQKVMVAYNALQPLIKSSVDSVREFIDGFDEEKIKTGVAQIGLTLVDFARGVRATFLTAKNELTAFADSDGFKTVLSAVKMVTRFESISEQVSEIRSSLSDLKFENEQLARWNKGLPGMIWDRSDVVKENEAQINSLESKLKSLLTMQEEGQRAVGDQVQRTNEELAKEGDVLAQVALKFQEMLQGKDALLGNDDRHYRPAVAVAPSSKAAAAGASSGSSTAKSGSKFTAKTREAAFSNYFADELEAYSAYSAAMLSSVDANAQEEARIIRESKQLEKEKLASHFADELEAYSAYSVAMLSSVDAAAEEELRIIRESKELEKEQLASHFLDELEAYSAYGAAMLSYVDAASEEEARIIREAKALEKEQLANHFSDELEAYSAYSASMLSYVDAAAEEEARIIRESKALEKEQLASHFLDELEAYSVYGAAMLSYVDAAAEEKLRIIRESKELEKEQLASHFLDELEAYSAYSASMLSYVDANAQEQARIIREAKQLEKEQLASRFLDELEAYSAYSASMLSYVDATAEEEARIIREAKQLEKEQRAAHFADELEAYSAYSEAMLSQVDANAQEELRIIKAKQAAIAKLKGAGVQFAGEITSSILAGNSPNSAFSSLLGTAGTIFGSTLPGGPVTGAILGSIGQAIGSNLFGSSKGDGNKTGNQNRDQQFATFMESVELFKLGLGSMSSGIKGFVDQQQADLDRFNHIAFDKKDRGTLEDLAAFEATQAAKRDEFIASLAKPFENLVENGKLSQLELGIKNITEAYAEQAKGLANSGLATAEIDRVQAAMEAAEAFELESLNANLAKEAAVGLAEMLAPLKDSIQLDTLGDFEYQKSKLLESIETQKADIQAALLAAAGLDLGDAATSQGEVDQLFEEFTEIELAKLAAGFDKTGQAADEASRALEAANSAISGVNETLARSELGGFKVDLNNIALGYADLIEKHDYSQAQIANIYKAKALEIKEAVTDHFGAISSGIAGLNQELNAFDKQLSGTGGSSLTGVQALFASLSDVRALAGVTDLETLSSTQDQLSEIFTQTQSLHQLQQAALQEQEQGVQNLLNLARSLEDHSNSLLGSDLNPATSRDKLAQLSGLYQSGREAALAAAGTADFSDDQAISDFQNSVDLYLQAARDVHKTSSTYRDIFDQTRADEATVVAAARATGAGIEPAENSAITQLLSDLKTYNANLQETITETQSQLIAEMNVEGTSTALQVSIADSSYLVVDGLGDLKTTTEAGMGALQEGIDAGLEDVRGGIEGNTEELLSFEQMSSQAFMRQTGLLDRIAQGQERMNTKLSEISDKLNQSGIISTLNDVNQTIQNKNFNQGVGQLIAETISSSNEEIFNRLDRQDPELANVYEKEAG